MFFANIFRYTVYNIILQHLEYITSWWFLAEYFLGFQPVLDPLVNANTAISSNLVMDLSVAF